MMSSKSALVATLSLLLMAVPPVFAAGAREVPVPVRTVAPIYPPELRAQGVSGLVLVKCAIDPQGNVTTGAVRGSTATCEDLPVTPPVSTDASY